MTYEEAVEYFENPKWSRSRPGLERIRALLRALGDPQKGLKIVHVAGSNGKGSVCAMFASVLREAGFKTGMFISPQVLDYREQMQINGEMIAPERLGDIAGRVCAAADPMYDHPSRFELLTAAALLYFREEGCGAVVLEVGMGGALDSTNAIDAPELAVITNVALEHTEYLGSTIEQIAAAKAGIIKPGCSCVCYDGERAVTEIVRRVCEELGVRFCSAGSFPLRSLCSSVDGQSFVFDSREYRIPLLGHHQLKNAATVLCGVEMLRGRGWTIPDEAVRRGLASVSWPARLEVLGHSPLFLLDGGHNPQCAQALAEALDSLSGCERAVFVIGVLADKDYPQMVSILRKHALRFICITPDSPRALEAGKLAEYISETGSRAEAFDDIPSALDAAFSAAGDAPVVSFGSLYSAGEVRKAYLPARKKFVRRLALRSRAALGEKERAALSEAACSHIISSESYRRADTVMIYRAVRSELSLATLEAAAAADGKRLVYPRCVSNGELAALSPCGDEAWSIGPFGIPEPVFEKSVYVRPDEIDLVVCPCSAFDGECRRLGMGAGYYDRFLPLCENADIFAAAFECQKVACVPSDTRDVRMDCVYTEKAVYMRQPHRR